SAAWLLAGPLRDRERARLFLDRRRDSDGRRAHGDVPRRRAREGSPGRRGAREGPRRRRADRRDALHAAPRGRAASGQPRLDLRRQSAGFRRGPRRARHARVRGPARHRARSRGDARRRPRAADEAVPEHRAGAPRRRPAPGSRSRARARRASARRGAPEGGRAGHGCRGVCPPLLASARRHRRGARGRPLHRRAGARDAFVTQAEETTTVRRGRSAPGTVPCATCATPTDPLRAARVAIFGERFRYFCSEACRTRFDPEKLATPLPRSLPPPPRPTPPPPPPSTPPPDRATPFAEVADEEEAPEAAVESVEAVGARLSPPPALAEGVGSRIGTVLLVLSAVGGSLAIALALAGGSRAALTARLVLCAVSAAALVTESWMGARDETEPRLPTLL